MPTPYFLKNQLIRTFNATASTCDQASVFQKAVGERLLERLDSLIIHPKNILHLGASTGYFTHQLSSRWVDSRVLAIDFAKHRLFLADRQDREQWICADIERLPLANNSVDLIFSNLSLLWIEDIATTFKRLRCLLRPKGLFLFSMLGLDTLKELRASLHAVGYEQHVHDFLDMHPLGDRLLQAGFQDPVMDVEHMVLEYEDLNDLFDDLKRSGAVNLRSDRQRGLMGKSAYVGMREAYQQHYGKEGFIPATFEVIYGYAMSKFEIKKII